MQKNGLLLKLFKAFLDQRYLPASPNYKKRVCLIFCLNLILRFWVTSAKIAKFIARKNKFPYNVCTCTSRVFCVFESFLSKTFASNQNSNRIVEYHIPCILLILFTPGLFHVT